MTDDKSTKKSTFFRVNRLSISHEFDEIIKMQKDAKEFTDHYPKHMEWLQKAIGEMNQGIRVAYGLFTTDFSGSGMEAVTRLAGSIIINKGTFSKVVEMKNLFVDSAYRNMGGGRQLYGEVEEYCRRKGYKSIETEVPCQSFHTINFLHKTGFRVTKIMSSRFKMNDQIYVMEKQISPTYAGDPFDFRGVCEWYVSEFWGYTKTHSGGGHSIWKSDTTKIYGQRSDHIGLTMGVVVESDNKDLKAAISKASENTDTLVVFLKSDQAIEKVSSGPGVKVIDEAQVLTAVTGHLGYPIPKFDASDIGGMIISFNPAVFSELQRKYPAFVENKSDVPYYKGGPIGQYVKPNHTVALFSEGDEHFPAGAIRGFAKVVASEINDPETIRLRFSGEQKLIDDEYYSRLFKAKTNVVGFKLRDIKFINPIEKIDIFKIFSDGEPFEINDIGHRYISTKQLSDFLSLAEVIEADSRAIPPTNAFKSKS